MKHKFYFYYFIFHNNFMMRGDRILMTKKLSLRFSKLSEVTQVARDCARLESLTAVPPSLRPHSKRLEMKVLGHLPGKNWH